MGLWHPRMAVQTVREGEGPEERQPPEFAIRVILWVSVPELDLSVTRCVSLGSLVN